ncbi:MAG: protealysin inhibitor emfourin [Methanoregula sp.]
MQIRYVQSGGFSGMRKTSVVDTQKLPADEAKKVQDLVESAGFFNLPEKFPKPKSGADYFTYSLTVEDGTRSHSIEVSEPSAPESLRPLIRYLAASKKS